MYISGIKVLRKRDAFGAKLVIFNETKRKAWNKLVKNGWTVQPNNRYLKKDRMYVHNNRFLTWLSIKH